MAMLLTLLGFIMVNIATTINAGVFITVETTLLELHTLGKTLEEQTKCSECKVDNMEDSHKPSLPNTY